MNTKLLLASSAIFLGSIGLATSFFPQEMLAIIDLAETRISVLLVQILAAQFMGFGMLNWMAQGNMLGGIYYRPVTMGNLVHFGVGAIGIIKAALATSNNTALWLAAVPYTIYALLFAKVFFKSPVKSN
ncbi:hypothetical protein JMN32_26840 [Fulvivirga sp. 29W222]|uniref:Uncharacterized protein n=1 Tax=Fulvivirga marina TaxID=2494733 RepID=A0A937KEV0_9BACT|nr:hypothetical protein [Fulvivirga marina]MBL6449959.1 hypothetical protein [Fulvivirga marina]